MKQNPAMSDDVGTGVIKNNTNEKKLITVTETYPSSEETEDIKKIENRLFEIFDEYR